ncbi:MAG TPA: imidazole glycerol phosphate synthase subunit HisH [Spirochaetota bacterium]|nr:imidazole glycerol phosphate synthase subunit HisH [Spirochaetota bacterium]
MISIIDYGMGNLRSVVKAFELFTPDVRIINDPRDIESSSAVVLPGDGAFGMAMQNLQDGGWVDPVFSYINSGKIFVGICVGYQLLFESSEEFGYSKGLGLIPGNVKKFDYHDLKVPHMGWNNVKFTKPNPFIEGIEDNSYFYFIHTYYPEIKDISWVCGETEYGALFSSIVCNDNVFGTQFHPEKSHKAGLKIIENIVNLTGCDTTKER